MFDIIPLCVSAAEVIGRCHHTAAGVRHIGSVPYIIVARFQRVVPTSQTLWLGFNLKYAGLPTLFVRFSDGEKDYYISDSMEMKVVSKPSEWESERTSIHIAQQNLDLWQRDSLQIVVASAEPGSVIKSIELLVEQPCQADTVEQTVRQVSALLSAAHPTIYHEEVLTQDRAEFQVGGNSTYVMVGTASALVDGQLRRCEVANNIVRVLGPTPKAGQRVRVGFEINPGVTVRDSVGSRTAFVVPKWIMNNLVNVGGTAVGRESTRIIGAFEVVARIDDLRMTVRGAADRQGDALSMRAKMDDILDGFEIELTTGRSIAGGIQDTVEVVPGGNGSLPEAVATLIIPVRHVVSAKRLGIYRENNAYSGNTLGLSVNGAESTVQ